MKESPRYNRCKIVSIGCWAEDNFEGCFKTPLTHAHTLYTILIKFDDANANVFMNCTNNYTVIITIVCVFVFRYVNVHFTL